jgi:phosphatidylserine decarboxylase
MLGVTHQYVERETSAVRTEKLFGDRFVRWAYQAPWEDAAWLCRVLSSERMCQVLGVLNYDLPFVTRVSIDRFVRSLRIDLSECVEPAAAVRTQRKLFERKIRYWETRPMAREAGAIVSPCDARLLLWSLRETDSLYVKRKIFTVEELLGAEKTHWHRAFAGGDVVICRLTPEKYHYNHAPADGMVADFYEVEGRFHSCNPSAVIVASSHTKNSRIVTILDTDVPGGSGIGLIAMVEIVALMIGRIDQCYSEAGYADPRPVEPGMFLRKGQPKSVYRPGSSTTVLLVQPNRLRFCEDLLRNAARVDVRSRFSHGFGRPLVETDVKARSTIGYRLPGMERWKGEQR